MILLAFFAQAVAAPVPVVDFKGAKLGETIEEFRSHSWPADRWGPMRVHCSNEGSNSLAVSTAEREIGVVQCAPMQQIGDSLVPASVYLTAEDRATARYYFFEGKLFRIEVYPSTYSLRIVRESLEAKFGKPAIRREGTFQVRSGATFPQITEAWALGDARIVLTAPDNRINLFSVYYTDTKAAQRAEKLEAQLRDPRSVM